MPTLDGKMTEVINRFCISKPEGIELIGWANAAASLWMESGAKFRDEGIYDYEALGRNLENVYAHTKKRDDHKAIFAALSPHYVWPAMERAVRESGESELDLVQPSSIRDASRDMEVKKFLADKGHSTVVHEWISKQRPMFFAAQKSGAVGHDTSLGDWLEANWRSETGAQRGTV